MILYYALGGGLGHLTRARKVLGEREDAVLLTSSRHARDARVTAGRPVIPVPRRLGHDRAAFRAWLTTLFEDLNPGELQVTTLPFLDRYELLPWYAACDWLAIPSFYDGLPNVLVEAAALGVPMLASRVDGMADVLVDGETALLFDPGDEPRAAWALQRAARLDTAEHGRMADACRTLARTTLDGDREIAAYVEALEQTRGERRLAAVR